jgi:diketogulonate reductase-like aldo/keto reductase
LQHRPLDKTPEEIPVVGMGTWAIEGSKSVEALRLGLNLGMRFIDTAEMYGSGHSEELVAEALKGQKEKVFVASKVSPQHFAYENVLRSCQASLRRLQMKQMDLYQLHWPNPRIPISETMKAMEKLVNDGLIRHIGVSNFSVRQMKEAQTSLSKYEVVSNQVEYSLIDRTIESDILPFCQEEKVTVIAYSPLGQGKIPTGQGKEYEILDSIARKLEKSREQIALAWVLQHDGVVTIPKASENEHVKENAEVGELKLNHEDMQTLNGIF